MSDASEWTLISPLASFRCRLDDIFSFAFTLSYTGGVLVNSFFLGFKNGYTWFGSSVCCYPVGRCR
jgi:hypothetical protein